MVACRSLCNRWLGGQATDVAPFSIRYDEENLAWDVNGAMELKLCSGDYWPVGDGSSDGLWVMAFGQSSEAME